MIVRRKVIVRNDSSLRTFEPGAILGQLRIGKWIATIPDHLSRVVIVSSGCTNAVEMRRTHLPLLILAELVLVECSIGMVVELGFFQMLIFKLKLPFSQS